MAAAAAPPHLQHALALQLQALGGQTRTLTIHTFGLIVAIAVFTGLTIGARRFRHPGIDRALGEKSS